MARTSSLNCLSCKKSLPSPWFTELPPPFSLKTPFFTEKCFVASPSQKSAPNVRGTNVTFSVSSIRCSPPKVFRGFLTHFWRNFDAFLTYFRRSSFPKKQDPFWRIFDAFLSHFWRILAIADAFSENTFWTIPTFPRDKRHTSTGWLQSKRGVLQSF